MALIDGEYYYRPPAKKTVAKKALYYPKTEKIEYTAPQPPKRQGANPTTQAAPIKPRYQIVDQYLLNRGYGTTPATQQTYKPPAPAPVKYGVNGLPSYAQAPISNWAQNIADKAANFVNDKIDHAKYYYDEIRPRPIQPRKPYYPTDMEVLHAGMVPDIFNINPNFKLQTQKPAYSVYEEDAANYGLPGWTAPGMRPAGVPTPPAVQAGNNPLITKLPTRRQPIAPVRRPAMSDIYEDDAVNYGLPGYTALGNSPTGAPPPGTRPYYSGTSGVAGKPVVASPWISNVTPPLTDWRYYRQGFPIAKQVPDSIVPGTPSFDAWRKAYPMAQLPDPANLASQPKPQWQTNNYVNQFTSPATVNWNGAPAAPLKHNVTRMPGTPATNAVQTKAPYQFPQWHPYQYRGEFDPYEMGGSPYKITDPFNFPPMTMEELMASGADPWAHDPYDTAGNPYRMEGDGSGMSSGGGDSGGGGYGWGGGGWGGGGGGGGYGASSGVSSYLPGAGGGYGARASAPNYTGRGAGRGSSYAGSESYNTPQWRMPMLVWNI